MDRFNRLMEMKRNWNKYIHKNRTEGDCQLVAAINVYYYLTGKIVDNGKYEELIELSGCRYGSAISIDKIWDQLGIEERTRYGHIFSLPKKDILPLEINIWHKFFGFHSILAVDYCRKVDAFRVINFRYVANNNGWIFTEDLHHFVVENPNRDEPRWQCRTLNLKEVIMKEGQECR